MVVTLARITLLEQICDQLRCLYSVSLWASKQTHSTFSYRVKTTWKRSVGKTWSQVWQRRYLPDNWLQRWQHWHRLPQEQANRALCCYVGIMLLWYSIWLVMNQEHPVWEAIKITLETRWILLTPATASIIQGTYSCTWAKRDKIHISWCKPVRKPSMYHPWHSSLGTRLTSKSRMDQCTVATLLQWRTSRKHATLNHSRLRMCRVLVYEISVSYRQLSQTKRLPSRPNKTPPNGLPKATDTPAAAAAANSFLFCAIKELKINSFQSGTVVTHLHYVEIFWRTATTNMPYNTQHAPKVPINSQYYTIDLRKFHSILLCQAINQKQLLGQGRELWWAGSMDSGKRLGRIHLGSSWDWFSVSPKST